MAASKTSPLKSGRAKAVSTMAIGSKAGAAKGGTSQAGGDARPTDLLRESLSGLSEALMQRASHSVTSRIESTTKGLAQRAADVPGLASGAKNLADGKPLKAVAGVGASRVKEKVKDAFSGLTGGGGGKGGGGRGKLKITNIVESVDVGVPIKVAYDQWTQFTEFPSFMKKVEHVEQQSPEKVAWKAQILWSHRQWESTITEQVPEERIVWTSKGEKGKVDGAVTFHELAPSLTRVVVVLVYHPQGLFEHVGNMFRAQGRRARLELKHYQRHVMTQTILHADELEGWRGEIHGGKVAENKGNGRGNGDSNGNGNRATKSVASKSAASKSAANKPSPSKPTAGRSATTTKAAASKKTAASESAASRSAPSKPTAGRSAASRAGSKTSERQQRPARSRSGRSGGKAGTS